MIDHEGLIKEARAWIVKPGSGELLERLAGALEARVLSPSEGDLGLLGPKEALHAAADASGEPAGEDAFIYKMALHDLVMLKAQDDIGCVPPPTKEQWDKAWAEAEELTRNEP